MWRRYNARPVLLFYADDVPADEYSPDFLTRICPPSVRHLLEVIHCCHSRLP